MMAKLQGRGLIVAMALGSVTLWIGSPAFWLWLTSHLQSGTQARMGPYAVMLLGILVTSVAVAKGLAALNSLYGRVIDREPVIHIHVPWHRSLGGEHERRLRTVTVLDVVMVVSVIVAATAFVIWFFVVNPTPPGLEPGPAKN